MVRWIAFLLIVLGLVATGCGTGGGETAAPAGPAPASTAPAVTFSPPKALFDTAEEFVRSAVLRADLERAWQLATTELRGQLTHEEWLTGTIPVVPFPKAEFGKASFDVVEASPDDVMLDVLIAPRAGSPITSTRFFMHLVPSGDGWRVSYWAPQGGGGGVALTP